MRIERACRIAMEHKVDALLIENPSDVFYLTGQWFSLACLVLNQGKASLLVDGRYFGQAKGNVPCEVILAEKEALKEALKGAKKVGFDSFFATVDKTRFKEASIPGKEWIPISRPIKEMRVCKDSDEIAALKRAAKTTWDGYQHILKHLKEGVEEQELAIEFETHIRKRGALKTSFDPIIAFGENSALPHYWAGKQRLKKNQIALFDLGAIVERYSGDMTRVFFFGQQEKELLRFYDLVKEAHDLASDAIRPGMRVGELDERVRAYFAKEGVERLFSHSLGHGVGIDVHEYPLVRFDSEDKDLLLRPGMVFTIEPGLYLPGIGGVRYENTFAVTETGSENFYDEV